MPPASRPVQEFADYLGRGGTVITGNQRAARTLRLAFDRTCRAEGLGSWQPPAIFAWDTWTVGLYRQALLEGSTTRMLLNRTQELQVWRSVIDGDSQWTSLQTVESLAVMAADAWQLLCAYRGQRRPSGLGVSGDTRTFQRWAQAFHRRCTLDEYLSTAELEEALAAGTFLRLPAEIMLMGFDGRTPAQQLLIDAVRRTGVLIEDDDLTSPATHCSLAIAATPQEELLCAALWARAHVLANPGATVAVIVPGLASERREIDRNFRRILAPELEDIAATNIVGPYEFSLGQPLAGTPLVIIALQILRFVMAELPVESITHLLLSPYFAVVPNELSARAEFDAFELRNTPLLRPEITLDRLISLVSTAKRSARLPGLLGQLRSLERAAEKLFMDKVPRQRAWSDSAEIIRELLRASGWPGAKPLDSNEFQTRQKFESALDELATLDFEGTRTGFIEAIERLKGLLERTLFAPESREAPIQIMSPLEAAGSRFDALCFLRANDLDWPVRPSPNPLLGWRLQRELSMPGSDAALDFAHAQRITDRIAASADTLVFSYAEQTADGDQHVSPLLAGLGLKPADTLEVPPEVPVVELERVEDDAFIPLTNFTVRGGVNILKLQAACGFRAFAETRLWSTRVETLQPGMDALESGNIVHAVLDHLWSELGTQAALRTLTAEERAAHLARSIAHGLRRADARLATDSAASSWDRAYLDLQSRRLFRVLTAWLELELARPPFEVVQREERETVTIGPLTMDLRIDRVDRLLDEEGGHILIDYKTGHAKPSDWAGERPDEPQLPLYAVLREPESLVAVAFANIRAGNQLALQGLASRGGLLLKQPKTTFATLEEQLASWHEILTTLAGDFAAGDARVLPKTYPKTCKHCGQRLLCRLDPALLAIVEEEEEAFEEADG